MATLSTPRRRPKPSPFFSEVALKIVYPILFFLLLLGFGAWGFHEYYTLFEAHGWSHLPAQVDSGNPAAAEAVEVPGTPETAGAPSPKPDWYRPERRLSWWDAFLLATGLTTTQTTLTPEAGFAVPWQLRVARVLGLMVLPAAFFVLAFRNLREDGLKLRIWWWGLFPWHQLTLLCGLGWQGHEIACQVLADPRTGRRRWWRRLAILEKDPANPFAGALRRLGAAVLFKDATVKRSLEEVSVRKAGRIFAVSDDDETNCRIVRQIADLCGAWNKPNCLQPDRVRQAIEAGKPVCRKCRRRSRCIRCHASIRHPRTRGFLENSTKESALAVQTFDPERLTARRLLARYPFCPVQQEGNPRHAHVVIFGWSPIARAILLQVLNIGYFGAGSRLQVTVVCRNHESCRREFHHRYPCLDPGDDGLLLRLNDCPRELREYVFPAVEFIELPESDAHLLDDDFALYRHMDRGWLVSAYFCLDDGLESRALVRVLRDKLRHRRETLRKGAAEPQKEAGAAAQVERQDFDVQVFFYYNYPEDDVVAFDPEVEADRAAGMILDDFGGFDRDCSIEAIESFVLDDLARQVMKFYLVAYDEGFRSILENLENAFQGKRQARQVRCLLQQFWDQDDEWQHESNRYAADHALVKLRCLGIDARLEDGRIVHDGVSLRRELEDPVRVRVAAEMEHRRWCAERLLMGWRPYRYSPDDPGITPAKIEAWFRDDDAKQAKKEKRHLDLVPFDDLPAKPDGGESEQEKDFGAIRELPAMLDIVRNAGWRR